MKAFQSRFKPYMIHKAREYGARRFLGMTNEYDWLKKNAIAYSKRDAVIDTFYGVEREKRRKKTWAEVLEDVNLYIFNLMNRGVFKGSTLIVQLPNCIEHYYSYLAASKLGCWHLSNHVDFGRYETLKILEHMDPDVAIIVPSWHGRDILGWYKEYQKDHPKLKHIFVVGEEIPEETESASALLNASVKETYNEEDLESLKMNLYEPWCILETSGTTGMPKLVVHGSYLFQQFDSSFSERSDFTPYTRCLVFGPLSGTSGKRAGITWPLYGGSTSILLTEYSAEAACRITEEEKVTMWGGIPVLAESAYFGPYSETYNLNSVNTFTSLGAPLSVETITKLLDKGITVLNGYGTTECLGATMLSRYQTRGEIFNTVGKVKEGSGLAIVDNEGNEVPQGEVGEVYFWSVHHGYYKQPEHEKEAWIDEGKWKDWNKSGDLGLVDENGNLRIVGRKKEMILRGALNIFPKEIEDILSNHSKIERIAVVKMPDPVLKERACAFVVPKIKGEKLTLRDLTSFMEEKGIAKMKYPERLEVLDEMPTNLGGKIDKAKLEQIIAAKIEEELKLKIEG